MHEDLGLRERKKAETRQAIADAALALALERGPGDVTVDDIAAAAGVSARTVFNYFARKEDLIYVDYHRVLATPDEAMRPGLAYDGVHPTETGYDAMASLAEPVLRTILPARKAKV